MMTNKTTQDKKNKLTNFGDANYKDTNLLFVM